MKKAKRNILKIIILISSVAALIFVVTMYLDSSKDKNKNDASVVVSATSETSSQDFDYVYSDKHEYTTAAESSRNIPSKMQLDVPFISQEPDLPTGCEITSLAEVLHFYGFNVDKEILATNYLPMRDTADAGCFAPAIVTAANSFLKNNNSNLTAHVISYSSVHSLFEYVAAGNPVIVWTSYDYSVKDITYREVPLSDGEYFSWPSYEHCVVLSGYNLTDRTVTFADPTYGIVTHTIDEFTDYYQKFFYQAAVIK